MHLSVLFLQLTDFKNIADWTLMAPVRFVSTLFLIIQDVINIKVFFFTMSHKLKKIFKKLVWITNVNYCIILLQ